MLMAREPTVALCRRRGVLGLLVGRVGLEPTTGGYENYGPVHRTHYLHGYHGAVPPMALIALFTPMARSTYRSTTYYGR
jgi:hypothetical protein